MRSPASLLKLLAEKARRLAPAALAAMVLSGCIGGTGTDTDNGVTDRDDPLRGHDGTAARVVDGDGNPLAGVQLVLHTPDFRPDSGAAQVLVLDSAPALITDTSGYARFHLASPGKYVVEGRLAGEVLLLDTLAVTDVKTLAVFTFRRRAVSPIRGRVRLASGLHVVSGTVFIRGTGRLAPIDTLGAYDLGALPAEAAGMAVGLTYRAEAREARVAEQKPDTGRIPGLKETRPVFGCREVTVDSAARLAPQPLESGMVAPSAPAFTSRDTVRLDSAKVSAVSRSCDSLAGGTVVAVRAEDTSAGVQKKDSVTTHLIAVDEGIQKAAQTGDFPAGAAQANQLVPLNGCVALPGTVSTTYEVRLDASGGSSDLLVADIAEKCLAK